MENETNRFSQWPVGTLLPESAVSHTGNSGKTRTRHCHLTIPMIPAAGNTSLPLATAEGLKWHSLAPVASEQSPVLCRSTLLLSTKVWVRPHLGLLCRNRNDGVPQLPVGGAHGFSDCVFHIASCLSPLRQRTTYDRRYFVAYRHVLFLLFSTAATLSPSPVSLVTTIKLCHARRARDGRLKVNKVRVMNWSPSGCRW